MSEDVPVNTGTVEWPSPGSAYFAVGEDGRPSCTVGRETMALAGLVICLTSSMIRRS